MTLEEAEIAGLRDDLERFEVALAALYWWVKDLPEKNPQQAEQREMARRLLGIDK